MELLSPIFKNLPDADPRADDVPFASFAFPIVTIVCYAWFVKNVPEMMKNRSPFGLERIMTVYNLLQVICCSYISIKCSYLAYYYRHSLICEPVDYTVNEKTIIVVKMGVFYYYLKLADLLDTVFLVLRKKPVTPLHYLHHGGMIMGSFIGLKYVCGGQTVWVGILNCYVHTVMYFYFLLCSYNKSFKASIWWKKHLTQLQMFQFFLFLVIYGEVILNKDCGYPHSMAWFIVSMTIVMLILFGDFYYKAYIAKPQKSADEKK